MALGDNIVSYWKFDVNSSTQVDSVASNDGTVTSATYTASGKINGGYDFGSGTSNYKIIVPDDASLRFGTGDFTISAWFKSAATTATNQSIVSKHYASGSTYHGYTMELTSDGYFGIYIDARPATTYIQVNDGVDRSTDTWIHGVMTVYHSGGSTYVEGFINGSSTVTSNTGSDMNMDDTNSDLAFGLHDQDSSQDFNGLIDEIGIWSRRLTNAEITSLYNSGSGLQYPFTTGLNLQLNIGDAWKAVEGAQVNIGDVWKTVEGIQINIGDAWKTVD